MNIPRIVLAATGSGSGKTVITCGLLKALRERGLKVCAYKAGPDYIDPSYLRIAGGCEVYNLDTWLTDKNSVLELFSKTSRGKDIAVIEGVMGLYDGGENSTAEISKLLKAPVVLVINAKSAGESAAAVALGFREYDRGVNLAGVILNFIGSSSHSEIISEALSRSGIKLLGALKRDESLKFPERHLGLVPANELSGRRLKDLRLGAEAGLDLEGILRVARCAPEIAEPENLRLGVVGDCLYRTNRNVRIGVARDEAFSFYYPESLDVLRELGAELIFFSPVHDGHLPEADGFIFGGGFPEMFAGELEANLSMRREVSEATDLGRVIFAECGGLMYLCDSIRDFGGHEFRMAGVIPASCVMVERPVIGYVEAIAIRDNIICDAGERIRGHEFHFSRTVQKTEQMRSDSFDFAFDVSRNPTKRLDKNGIYQEGYVSKNVLATYVHMNFMNRKTGAGPTKKFLSVLAKPAKPTKPTKNRA